MYNMIKRKILSHMCDNIKYKNGGKNENNFGC